MCRGTHALRGWLWLFHVPGAVCQWFSTRRVDSRMRVVWLSLQAARDNNVRMLRAFFLVHGTKKLLSAHCKAPTEGGRTLVHVAAWWGCLDVLRFLIQLGADINATDTMFSRTTPLIEAVRSGRRQV